MAGTDVVIKFLALGLVLTVAGVQANRFVVIPDHPNCPEHPGPIPVYFVHPTNCSKFYECHMKDAYELECPAGLHFNSRLNVCDHPQSAQCDGSGVPPVATETPTPTTPTLAPVTSTSAPPTTPPSSLPPATEAPTTATPSLPPTTPSPTTPSPTLPPATEAPTTATPSLPPATEAPTTVTPSLPPTTPTPTTSPTTWPSWTTTSTSGSTSQPGAGTTPDPVPSQPTDPHCPPAGAPWPNYWAHPGDCTKYLACWEGCVQEFKCPDGRYWIDELKACDHTNWYCTCPVIPPAPNVATSTTVPYV